MRTLIGLIVLYVLLGVAVVAVQVSVSPCDRPAVLDPGHRAITTRLDGNLINGDSQTRLRLAQDVAMWGVRFVQMVVLGDTSIKNFVIAKECRGTF